MTVIFFPHTAFHVKKHAHPQRSSSCNIQHSKVYLFFILNIIFHLSELFDQTEAKAAKAVFTNH